jgi:AP-2 complex subunit beta-1
VDFVRRAVRSIGRCAIKLEQCADACMNALIELCKRKVSFVVQEAVFVIKDIFRKYPGRFESFIPILCEHMDVLKDEDEAKASIVWIIGQVC